MKSRHLLHVFCAALLATAGVFGSAAQVNRAATRAAATADLKGGQADGGAEHGKSGEPHVDGTGDDQRRHRRGPECRRECTSGAPQRRPGSDADEDQSADEDQGSDEAAKADATDRSDEVDEAAGDDSDDGTDEAGKPDGGAGGNGHAKNKAGHGDDDQP